MNHYRQASKKLAGIVLFLSACFIVVIHGQVVAPARYTNSSGFIFPSSMNPSNSPSVTIRWIPSTDQDVVAYNVYQGTASGCYVNVTTYQGPVGLTNAVVTGLTRGATYYFAVTAIDMLGLESVFSNEVSYKVPKVNPPSLITP